MNASCPSQLYSLNPGKLIGQFTRFVHEGSAGIVRSILVWIGAGAVFFAVGLYMVLPDWTVTDTYTDTIGPGQYFWYEVTVFSGGRVKGDFTEKDGRSVSLYVFDQQQFRAFQEGSGVPVGLYSVTEVSRGSYAVSVHVPGTYHIVVRHGVAYEQSSQQVTITLIIDGTNTLVYGVGLTAVAIGVSVWVFGYVSSRRAYLRPWSS